MAEITASLVKELREKTGAGMLDCKKALTEAAGDMENAIDWLRKKGLSAAAKKAGRTASQGLVAATAKDGKGVVIEVNSETDFVARNDDFQAFVDEAMQVALDEDGDIEAVKNHKAGDKSVAEKLTDLVAKIGENLSLRRSASLKADKGAVVSYVHGAVTPGKGKIGVLVALESDAPADKLEALGKQIAMHVAATNPMSLDISGVDAHELEREKGIIAEQAKASGKPEAIIEKMVEGRLRKFYEEVVLLEQAFVMDPDKKVKDAVADFAKELGSDVKITGFVRFGLGEGIEKEETDFAAEVAAQLNK